MAGRPPGDAPDDDVLGVDHVVPGDGTGADDLVDEGTGDDDPGPHDPLRFNQWMKRSAAGAVLSGIALGLQQALEPKRELPAFVMEAPGEPEDPDAPITLRFDPDDPTKTVAVIRARTGSDTTTTPDATSTGPGGGETRSGDAPEAVDP